MNQQIKFLLLFCILFFKINEVTQCQQSSRNGIVITEVEPFSEV
jgi:hypothetical protein